MNIFRYAPENYSILVEWAHGRKYVLPRPSQLPPTGIIVIDATKKQGHCAAFLFKTDAKMAVIGAIISNPEADKVERQKSVDFAMEYLSDLAKKEGFETVVISSNIPKFKERIGKKFTKFEDGVTVYGRPLV